MSAETRAGAAGAPDTPDLASADQAAPGGGLWSASHRALTVGLVLTITFIASEALAVVTIMPVVARDLGGLSLYGWVFSAFMLGNVVGIVAAGRQADRFGPARPFLAGLALFGAGLAIAGLAPSMLVLVAGRALQGIGAGAVPAIAYVSIGRSLPERLQARMMAVLSTAWVVPGLVGPAISAAVASLVGWRWVFLGLLPVVAVTGSLALPALFRLGKQPIAAGGELAAGTVHRLRDGLTAAAGSGLVLTGLSLVAGARDVIAGVVVLVLGIGAISVSLPRLLPAGTFVARPGLPTVILSRGLAYAPTTLLMLREAPQGREGWASASLSLADVLGTAIGIGLGGAAVTAATAHGWPLAAGVGIAFALAGAGALALALASRRLPLTNATAGHTERAAVVGDCDPAS